MKYLLTHIDDHVEVDDDEVFIFTRGRTASGDRVEAGYFGFYPRFFAKDTDIRKHIDELKASDRVVGTYKNKKIPHSYRKEPVGEVWVKLPKDVHGQKDSGGICDTILSGCDTLQSRIPYIQNFLFFLGIKSGIEVKGEPDKMLHGIPMYSYKHIMPFDDLDTKVKINPLDIETYFFRGNDPTVKNTEVPITVISYKNFDEKILYMYCYNPNSKPVKDIIKTKFEGALKDKYKLIIKPRGTEVEMLRLFINEFVENDPDISTAWNSNYDFGYIINRCKKLNKKLDWKERINVNKLSPYSGFMPHPVYVRNGVPYIAGRTVMDEQHVYQEHTKFEGMKAYPSLEYTSQHEMKVGKVNKRHPKTNKLRTTGQLCDQDFNTLIKYNAIDTELVELIAKRKGLWEYLERLRRNTGIPIEKSLSESVFIHALCVRKSMDMGMAYATRNFENTSKDTFKGGLVLTPKPGIYDAVCSYDFKALYAFIITMLNMSLETLIEDPAEESRDYLDTCYKTPNGLYFKPKSEQVGFIPGLIEDLIKDGDETKAEWLKAFDKYGEHDPRAESLSLEYDYKKSMRNSVYGTFVFYSIPIAEAIAAIGRDANGTAANLAMTDELHLELVDRYDWKPRIDTITGDTDSGKLSHLNIYDRPQMVWIGEWISGKLDSLCEKYNVPENLFFYRPEEVYDQYFLMPKKKCYSGHIIAKYKETIGGAVWRDTDEFQIVGHKKSDISILGNDGFDLLQRDCCRSARQKFDLWLQMSQQIAFYKKKFLDPTVPLYMICPTTGIRENMSDYGRKDMYGHTVGIPSHVKAALWSNRALKSNFNTGSKVPELHIVGRGEAIALPEDWSDAELAEFNIIPDRKKMFKKQIINKFKPVADVLGFDIRDLVIGKRQGKIGDLK